jgi:hypothetical protein
VRRLRRVSLGSVVAGLIAFLVMWLGAGIVAAAVFAVVYSGVQGVFGQRIKERFERQPELRLVAVSSGEVVDRLDSDILPPWSFDPVRIVAYEVSQLRREADAAEEFARRGPGALTRVADPWTSRPRAEDFERAREEFDRALAEYEPELHVWLERYGTAARSRADTFELSLAVLSAKTGAYAEDVVLTLDLPAGSSVTEEWPTVPPPPQPPKYIAPQPRSLSDIARPRFSGLGVEGPWVENRATWVVREPSPWQAHADAQHLSIRLGAIHHDSTKELDPLMLRMSGPGSHPVHWTLRTKNGRRHSVGTLELTIPEPGERAAFARLYGIERYPDVPFINQDGEVLVAARSADPPTSRPTVPADETLQEPLARLGQVFADNEWLRLGLGGDADSSPSEGNAAA